MRRMRFCGFFLKVWVAGIGHLGRQVEHGLLAVAEVRGDDQLAGVAQA
jgi:hypothetical protein